MVKFDEIISASFEWTTAVLFRPFSPRKWLILTFIAFLAGSIAGGNPNFNFRDRGNHTKKASAAQQHERNSFQSAKIETPKEKPVSKEEIKKFFKKSATAPVIFIVIPAVIAGVILFLTLLWVCSRFYFIFLEDIAKNDASIVAPFRSNKDIGNSLFKFNLIFIFLLICIIALTFFMGFASLSKVGAFNNNASLGFWKIVSALLPAILLSIFIILMSALIGLIMNDFVTVVMFKDRERIAPAIKKAFSVLALNKLNFFLYVLIKIGLVIVSSIIYSITSFVAAMGLIFPAGIIASIFYFIYKVIPKDAQSIFIVAVVVMAVPVVLFLWYCLMCMYLPFAVFFRVFSVKFFGKLDGRYNLFKYSNF
ncbi:MAG: hypothetical protein M0R20_02580 [Candidatus Omnitrophica bacterium]|jgi:hypothetical protein|nr:hypothetical protein [Candidatus Omnitrophota bacterium]